ncbi:MAG TPA: hypothetical protein VJ464_30705 [Blastocatellia bacterium]|nr:hypothetical protein [Blastocatellia bacterium]
MRQIIQADRLHDEARAHDGSWQCSFCKQTNPKGKHISVPVAGVLAERGQAKRADDDPERDEGEFVALPPLVKDYPTTHRPYLYLCHECGIACGVVTEKELATGRREDDLTN